MNTGIGFSEIGLILVLVLIFFGSKEIPAFIRNIAKFTAKIRYYTDNVRRELDSMTQSADLQVRTDITDRKNSIREQYLSIRNNLNESSRAEKSLLIYEHLKNASIFKNAVSVMIYLNTGSEVETVTPIKEMLKTGKRIIIPYFKESSGSMEISEISDIEKDIAQISTESPEPHPLTERPFFKSDLQLIVCPGIAFDIQGGRIGRGKLHYENFLRDLKGRIPIVGLAFGCQILKDSVPFDYSDISMDQIITENGLVISS